MRSVGQRGVCNGVGRLGGQGGEIGEKQKQCKQSQ